MVELLLRRGASVNAAFPHDRYAHYMTPLAQVSGAGVQRW